MKQKFPTVNVDTAGNQDDIANVRKQRAVDALDHRIKEHPILSKVIGKDRIERPWTIRERIQIHSLHDSYCLGFLMTLFGIVKGWDVSYWLPSAVDRKIRLETGFDTLNGI